LLKQFPAAVATSREGHVRNSIISLHRYSRANASRRKDHEKAALAIARQ
jgi:hypothetical protein